MTFHIEVLHRAYERDQNQLLFRHEYIQREKKKKDHLPDPVLMRAKEEEKGRATWNAGMARGVILDTAAIFFVKLGRTRARSEARRS